jgi:flagellar biosynthesis/type III secretory pathway protein FliH
MENYRRTRNFRIFLPAMLAVSLVLAGLVPAGSYTSYSQRRSSRRPTPAKTQPQQITVYGQGYQRGYTDGFAQGPLDFRQRTPRDFQRSDAYQQRDQRYQQRWASSQQYRDGYDLGFELGYSDGYYGRAWNAAVPTNGSLLVSTRQPPPPPSPAPVETSVYAQGYQKGYGDGYAQGPSDSRQRVSRDFQRSSAYQRRDQRYDQRWASSQEYLDGYNLGFERGYGDGYDGRQRSSTVPERVSQIESPRPPVETNVYAQGYQKGYADGYAQGPSDSRQRASRDFQRSNAYQRRDQRYDQRWASSQEYRDGYNLGFERGYGDGYDGRQRNATVPERVSQVEPDRQDLRVPSIDVRNDTVMRLRLTTAINTKTNRVGDRFTATVVEPYQYEGATVDGHIHNLTQSGRVSGRTELSLTFDSITLSDGRRGPLSAQVERVIESETVKTVDEEGRVETGSRTRDSELRGGVGAGAGAIIGGIAAGGKGALIGALIGGAAGVGTVYVEGNKHIVLDQGTEFLIRVARSQQRAAQ